MADPLKHVKRWLRNYFGFSQREINGFLIIVLFMAAALAASPLVSLIIPDYNPTADKLLLDSLIAQIETAKPEPAELYPTQPALAEGELPSKPFDPNTLTEADWTRLGLPAYLATRINNYQAKGGMFRTREDVARIYGFPQPLYQKLYPLIDLPTRQELLANRSKPHYPSSADRNNDGAGYNRYPGKPVANRKTPLQLFDLNQADTTQLKRIRGIGTKRAEWIVKHRKRLGGFVSTQQLSEVFGLDSAVVDSLQKYAYVAPDFTPAKLYINRITVDELGRHPYLNFKVARAIIAYREQHGRYSKPDDLRKVKLVSDDLVRKVSPYLEF